jgi:hypothetical protein
VIGDLALEGALRGLPWPLSSIAGALSGDRLEAVRHATRPNTYSSAPSNAQVAIAAGQARYRAVMHGFAGLAGSEQEWDTDQGATTIGQLPVEQDLTTHMIPTSTLIPWLQRFPRDANTTRGYTGPVIIPGAPLRRWGQTTRFGSPRIVARTLLRPEQRTPTPREMTTSFVSRNPTGLRLDDPYNVPDEGYF